MPANQTGGRRCLLGAYVKQLDVPVLYSFRVILQTGGAKMISVGNIVYQPSRVKPKVLCRQRSRFPNFLQTEDVSHAFEEGVVFVSFFI